MATAPSDGTPRRPGRPSARPLVRDAFVALLAERPFGEITVDEVVRRAGVSRMAFYGHFASKIELLREVAAESEAAIRAASAGWLDGGPDDDPAAAMRASLEAVLVQARAFGPLVRVGVEASIVDAEVKRMWDRTIRGFVAAAARRIAADQAAGLARPDLDPHATAEALCWMVERLLYQMGTTVDGPARAVDIEAVVGVWLHALYPDPG